ncbi:enolase-phosphatase E1 [Hylaeus anthracinus]|uniref:enolase-phosphatase E1 n=1 Tax=Hylaeus anthracinus TaxID=313031 RepID=UPI0023B8D7FE|nr:enolase-phosphatase E1 [Hylaeus anthracinus]
MAGEKRTQDQEETLLSETVILVDIEGTTTSISFVKDTLFPYVRENLKKYIETKWDDEEFKQDYEKLKEQAKKDEEEKVEGFVPMVGSNTEEQKESLMKNVLWQMDCDRKTGALKQLQGHMWREAYNSKAVKAHVYEDVPKALESWTNNGRKVYVYSSGSVEAQKLLFGHSVHGDLLKYFSGYFDTEVGSKQESSSYKTISNKIGADPSSILFLTDTVKEAAAAKETGLSTVILLREGNVALSDEERATFTTIKSFLDLTFQTSTKRQKLEATETQENVTKAAPDVCEPMDTSEDVEMKDVSEKKDEKVEAKEAVEVETKECVKEAKSQKETKKSDTKTEEPMIIDAKDTPNTEKVTENVATAKVDQLSEVSTKAGNCENVPVVNKNAESTSAPSKSDADKPVEPEKVGKLVNAVEKIVEPTSVEATPATDAADVAACEPKVKYEQVSITESKTDEATNVAKETKPEASKVSDVKTNENPTEEKGSSSSSVEEKLEVSTCKTEKEAKEESLSSAKSADKITTNPSVTETEKSGTEVSSAKPAQESTKIEEKPTENGDVSLTNAEKVTAPTITESEATSNKAETNAEIKNVKEAVTEKKPEVETESVNEKSPKAKEAEETAVPVKDAEKNEVSTDASKEESTEKSVKEETVVGEVKETNATVDSEKKKLNGTTQNGDTDAPVTDDKLHRNGLNEGSSNENVNSSTSESTSAQNGEPESSSEANSESIKVKKVVDSTVADGAGEPDVVPPVVVAATS